jgi:Scramblase
MGCEVSNVYDMVSVQDKSPLFVARERSNCCLRICCGPLRPLELSVTENDNEGDDEILHIDRPFRWCCCACIPSQQCRQNMYAMSGDGVLLGRVEQPCWFCMPQLDVYDERQGVDSPPVMSAHGPCCNCHCARSSWIVRTPDGERVGKVAKQWSGSKEFYSDADNFKVQWDEERTDNQTKSLFVTLTFLLDFLFFEDEKNSDN